MQQQWKWNRSIVTPIVVGSIAVLAACSNGGTGKEGGEGAPPVGEKAADLAKQISEQPTELVFYNMSNGWDRERFMSTYGDQIQKKFPNYTLKFITQENSKTLPNLVAINEQIDVIIGGVSTPTQLKELGIEQDISDLMKKFSFDSSHLEPTTLEIQRQIANGGIYGLPVKTTSLALFYNKDLFDTFGVAYPKDGMTWDELYDLTKKMTRSDGTQQYRGLTMAFQHVMQHNQQSAAHIDPKTNKALLAEDGFKRAFENIVRFYQIPGNELPKGKFALSTQQDPFYKEKNVAMLITLSEAGKTFKDLVNWDVVQVPFLADKKGIGMQSSPSFFHITKTSKNKDAAFQVAAYVTSEEYQQWLAENGTPSILKDQSKLMANFGKNDPYYKGKNIKSLLPAQFAAPTMKPKAQSLADVEVNKALEAVAAGQDVNSALREAAERTDKAIAEQAQ